MAWRHAAGAEFLRRFLAACALLILLSDVLLSPKPVLASSGLASRSEDAPSVPGPEDAEGDEIPDEVNDLAWPQAMMIARSDHKWSRLSQPSDTWTGAAAARPERKRNWLLLRQTHRPATLSILLCRLIC